jgi:hypothetical protein
MNVAESNAVYFRRTWPSDWPWLVKLIDDELTDAPGGCRVTRRSRPGGYARPTVSVRRPGFRVSVNVHHVPWLESGRDFPRHHKLDNGCGNLGCATPGHHYLTPVTQRPEMTAVEFRARMLDQFLASLGPAVQVEHVRADMGPCLPWLGRIATNAYGWLPQPDPYDRKALNAHRAAFLHHNGYLPAGVGKDGRHSRRNVGHRCDTRFCAEPSHLKDCTQKEQHDDVYRKGKPEFTIEDQVAMIRDIQAAVGEGRTSGPGWHMAATPSGLLVARPEITTS